jgi:AcrR family transcriptional regulator
LCLAKLERLCDRRAGLLAPGQARSVHGQAEGQPQQVAPGTKLSRAGRFFALAAIESQEGQAAREVGMARPRGDRRVAGTPATEEPRTRRSSPSWQCVRILDAVVEVVAERGLADTSVALVIARARVSRRAFHERFDGLDACLVAVMDVALERTGALLDEAFAREGSQYERLRHALAAVLEFLDAEPALARVAIVHVLAAGPAVLERRRSNIDRFYKWVAVGIGIDPRSVLPLAFESTMASVLGVIHARLVTDEPRPLLTLLGPLMGTIVGPYMDAAAVAREIEAGDELARKMLCERAPQAERRRETREIPDALLASGAHRARACLLYVTAHPGASNREVARGIGVAHDGQISGLLGRLERLGLLVKRSLGAGRRNAWEATDRGAWVAQALGSENGFPYL